MLCPVYFTVWNLENNFRGIWKDFFNYFVILKAFYNFYIFYSSTALSQCAITLNIDLKYPHLEKRCLVWNIWCEMHLRRASRTDFLNLNLGVRGERMKEDICYLTAWWRNVHSQHWVNQNTHIKPLKGSWHEKSNLQHIRGLCMIKTPCRSHSLKCPPRYKQSIYLIKQQKRLVLGLDHTFISLFLCAKNFINIISKTYSNIIKENPCHDPFKSFLVVVDPTLITTI